MKYTTILFDSDDTLLDFKASEKKAIYEAFKRAELPFNEDIRSDYSRINHDLWKALERGEVTTDELLVLRFARLFENYGYLYDPKSMNDLYFRCLADTDFKMEGADEILEYLYGRYELDIITNGVGYIQTSRLNNADIRKYIKHLFISGEIGASKPSKVFFDHVLSAVEEKDKRKILVIGDSQTSDIKGALDSGLDCVYIGTEDSKATYTINNILQLKNLL